MNGLRRRRAGAILDAGDCFAYDGPAYVGGDIVYGQVLEVMAHFPPQIDHVGADTSGVRVVLFSSDEASSTDDYYGWDFVDRSCVRLSSAEMARAREAGWPQTHLHFREVLGDEVPLVGSHGSPVRGLDELRAKADAANGS